MLESTLSVGLAFALALGLHFPLWWLRSKALGLVAGFGFLCFIPMALVMLSSGNPASASAMSQLWLRLTIIGFFVGPLLISLYHSFWLEPRWSQWLWIKSFFAIYSEIVFALFLYTLVGESLNSSQSPDGAGTLFQWVFALAVLLLACFGPCLGRLLRLAVPLIREA